MTNKLGFKIGLVAIMLSFFTFIGHFTNKVYAQNYGYDNSYQQFYNDLAPYGQWYQDPQYGFVWSPNVGPNFRPYYSNGYWAMTEYGNMWISNYNWGWAAFHYGRWILSDYGWIWIPGNEWAPAWVTWRQGGGYYGWAPLGPGISFSMSFGNSYYLPDPYWTFIPYSYIYNRSFNRYYSPRRTRTIIRNTNIINNTYIERGSRSTYATGPRRSDIESRTGRSVPEYQVGSRGKAGAPSVRNGSVDVYRPAIVNNSRTAAPRDVKQLKESVAPRNSNGNVRDGSNVSPVQRNTAPVERNTTPVQRNVTPVQRNTAPVERNATPVQRNTAPVERSNNLNQNQTAPRNTPTPNESAPVRRSAPVETRQQQPTRSQTPQRETRQMAPRQEARPTQVERSRESTPARSVEKRERFR